MNKFFRKGRGLPPIVIQWLKIMKLTFLFLLAGLLQVSASVYSQNTRLKLEMRDARVLEVLEEIEQQSEFRFAYSSQYIDVNRTVSVRINGKTIQETLDQLFEGTDVKYAINDRHILLYPKKMESESISLQQSQVSGKVTDKNGNPVPGVTVVVKGTTTGTITDLDG